MSAPLLKPSAHRRRDAFAPLSAPRLPHAGRRSGYGLASDIRRGLEFFWSRPHRTGSKTASQSSPSPP